MSGITIASGVTATEPTSSDISDFNSGVASALNASGSAPIYAARAWVLLDDTTTANLAGTYTRSSNVVTVTATNHGLSTGNYIYFDATSGSVYDGVYAITVTGVNTFTFTDAGVDTSGNCNLNRNTVRASKNVASVGNNGSANGIVNFISGSPGDGLYAVAGTSQSNSFVGYDATYAYKQNAFAFNVNNHTGAGSSVAYVSLTFFW